MTDDGLENGQQAVQINAQTSKNNKPAFDYFENSSKEC